MCTSGACIKIATLPVYVLVTSSNAFIPWLKQFEGWFLLKEYCISSTTFHLVSSYSVHTNATVCVRVHLPWYIYIIACSHSSVYKVPAAEGSKEFIKQVSVTRAHVFGNVFKHYLITLTPISFNSNQCSKFDSVLTRSSWMVVSFTSYTSCYLDETSFGSECRSDASDLDDFEQT